MPKNILQDIVKNKSTQNKEIIEKKIFYSDTPDKTSSFYNLEIKKKKNISYGMLWLIAFISVVFLFFAISLLFFNAKVNINLKTKDFVLDKSFLATRSTKSDSLSYDLVVLQDEELKEIIGIEEKDYLEKAEGTVLLYNDFSSSPQNLLIDTRLEGSNGKIYKTKKQVVIPGKSKDLPGKVSVEIYASEPGSEYNSSPIDFKILGFKNTSKYSKFYGRSVGEIKGGLKGKSRQINEQEKENIEKELKANLFNKLLQKATNQIPESFVLLKDASVFKTEEAEIIQGEKDGTFIVKIKGTFNGIIFNKEKLTKEILEVILPKEEKGTFVSILNVEELSFIKSSKGDLLLDDSENITFNLTGTVKTVWDIDEEEIINELVGKNKKDFNQILLKYPNIESASLKIKPVWKNSFPPKAKDIKLIVNSPENSSTQ